MNSNNKLSRREMLKKQQQSVNQSVATKAANDFVEAGGDIPLAAPKQEQSINEVKIKPEATQSVTCALTSKYKKALDNRATKLNYLLIDDVEDNYTVNRSSLVKTFINMMSKMTDSELADFYRDNQGEIGK
ncbi:hypothetical protein [Psychromonas sp. KJ10-2]|uniref:hypothetical protein n=1 Tax=Psychromonas sp. KJ10-2 TaxID=3391822 RepID=UPI0039B5EA4A